MCPTERTEAIDVEGLTWKGRPATRILAVGLRRQVSVAGEMQEAHDYDNWGDNWGDNFER